MNTACNRCIWRQPGTECRHWQQKSPTCEATMTEADICTRQLQQISVFALRQEAQALTNLDGTEALLRQRTHRVLQASHAA